MSQGTPNLNLSILRLEDCSRQFGCSAGASPAEAEKQRSSVQSAGIRVANRE